MSNTKIKLDYDAQDFLFYSCFGESWSKLKSDKEEDAIYCCFRRAYRDFSRTMSFDKSIKSDHYFPEDVYKKDNPELSIGEKIKHIKYHKDDFDDYHSSICQSIIDNASATGYVKGHLYYGQAQKWLNMTLKYMYMTGLWTDEFEKVENLLHIPLDRYILKAVFYENTRKEINEKEVLIVTEYNWANSYGAIIDKYIDSREYNDKGNNSFPWSRIDNVDDYNTLQGKIKENYNRLGMAPLKWENRVWLLMSSLPSN